MGRINAGDLNKRVALITTGEGVPDGRGGYKEGQPDTRRDLYARVRPLRGGELLALGQVLNSNAYEVTLRREVSVLASAKQRIAYQGQELNVQRCVSDEFNEYWLLTCFNSGKQG